MSVDIRMKGYFANVTMYHQTGEEVWLTLLDLLAMTDSGPAGEAAGRFCSRHKQEDIPLDSS